MLGISYAESETQSQNLNILEHVTSSHHRRTVARVDLSMIVPKLGARLCQWFLSNFLQLTPETERKRVKLGILLASVQNVCHPSSLISRFLVVLTLPTCCLYCLLEAEW